MKNKIFGVIGVLVAILAIGAAPAWAGQIRTANVTAVDCTGYTITVTGVELFKSDTIIYYVDYTITLTPTIGSPIIVNDTIDVTFLPGGNFNNSASVTWASLGVNLNGTYTLTGTATLKSKNLKTQQIRTFNTIPIVFNPDSVTCQGMQGNTCSSAIVSNFNGTAIGPGDTVWFNSALKVQGLPDSPVTLNVSQGSITFTANNQNYNVPVPDATINFSPSDNTATISFAGNTWTTNLPSFGLAGNDFMTGVGLPVPLGLPPGIKNITWNATFSSSTLGLSVQWQWAAAAYTFFSTDNNALGVKPVDDNHHSQYQNSDHAGTPENFKAFVTGGGRGGGGSNWTGSYSGTGSCALTRQGSKSLTH